MEVNDIQIHDWFNMMDENPEYNEFDYYAQVCRINIAMDTITSSNEDNWSISMSEPIRLTGEMLEDNGFSLINDGGGDYYCYGMNFELEVCYSPDGQEEYCLYIDGKYETIKYVHQLQHVLRDVGLVNLANNFKIG